VYLPGVSPRGRLIWFGSAGALVLIGVICIVVIGGLTGQVLAIALISLGLGGALLLVFFEVGLSEDRERAREQEARRRRDRARRDPGRRRPITPRWPRRPT
jgi:hypothetical protein